MKQSYLLIFGLCPFLPIISLYGHENSVMTERVQLQVQASKMRFLKKIKGVTSLTRCTSLKIRKSLEPLISKLKDLSLDGLAMYPELTKKNFQTSFTCQSK